MLCAHRRKPFGGREVAFPSQFGVRGTPAN